MSAFFETAVEWKKRRSRPEIDPQAPALEIRNLRHYFDTVDGRKNVLYDINLTIPAGQIVGLVGPSGCGKSTLFRAILGTHLPREGEVISSGVPVTGPSRNVGIVYQHYSLFDFLTAQENVAFGLMLDQTGLLYRFFNYFSWRKLRRQHLSQAADFLAELGLAHAMNLYPSEMSGGMRQRVAIAQAMIMHPRILLLDEPFGALDEATREDLNLMLLKFSEKNYEAKKAGTPPPYTILMITHELQEAIYVADRVLGLSQYHIGGHQGSTFIYDKACPDFIHRKSRDLNLIDEQKERLRNVVFSDELVEPHKYVTYWKDLKIESR
jgi:NitT/TauT family transport system ATP-binding protein